MERPVNESNPVPSVVAPKAPPLDVVTRTRKRRAKKTDPARLAKDEASGVFVSKCTPEVQNRIVLALKGGSTFADAAAFAGISRATFHDWMRTARAKDPPAELVEFMEKVDRELVTWKVGMVAQMTNIGNQGNNRAIEFMLERRFPQEYGRRTVVEHGNLNGEPFKVQAIPLFDPDLLTDVELETLETLLLKGRPKEMPIIDMPVGDEA